MAILDTNQWFITALLKVVIFFLVLGLIWLAKQIVGKDALSVFKSIGAEIKELWALDVTVGSLNFLGGILIFFIGLVIILGKKFGFLILLISEYIGLQQAEQIKESNESIIIFVGLTIYMLISILAVTANEKSKPINKKRKSSK